MIKKLAVLMGMVIAMDIFAYEVWRDSETGIEWRYEVNGTEISLGGGWSVPAVSVSTSGALIVPSEINGKRVTRIGGYAFNGCNELTKLTLPLGVITIGEYAFQRCEKLTDVVLPSSLETIGEGAFYYCVHLLDVTIPSRVTSISDYAFCGCSGLITVTIMEGSLRIGEQAFYQCTGLMDISIPSSVKWIDDYAFAYCIGLKNIALPTGLEGIGRMAFCACEGVEKITIPESVTNINSFAFEGCCGLLAINVAQGNANYISVNGVLFNFSMQDLISCPGGKKGNYDIPLGVERICDGAFGFCKQLTSVTMPKTLKDIGAWAFDRCSGLSSVKIGNSVTNIGSRAFWECVALKYVEIPSDVNSIRFCAFGKCSNLMRIAMFGGIELIESMTFLSCDRLNVVTFRGMPPEGLGGSYINKEAVIRYEEEYENEWLSVIDECGFTNAASATTPFPNGGPYIELVSGIEWTFVVTNGGSVIQNVSKGIGGKIAVPVSLGECAVMSIGSFALAVCKNLTGVVIPSSVTNIEENAFYECTMLRKVEFEGVAPSGWLNAVPGAWTKICYNMNYASEWENFLQEAGIEDGMPFVPGANSQANLDVCLVNLSVTNVVVQYVLNSIRPEIAVPVSNSVGFVNIITEVASSGAVSVPTEWKDNYPQFATKFGTDFGKALAMKTGKKDGAGNDMFVWQDFVAGTDPTDENDQFTASITIVDGVPVISYTPVLTAEQAALRVYKTYGKMKLTDTAWTDITAKTSEERANYNFFKVSVEMK